MTEIRFYHLLHTHRDTALPAILQQALKRGMRVVIKCGGTVSLNHLDNLLWTYQPQSFLPHSAKDQPEEQPIWLTNGDDTPNNADLLILIDDKDHPNLDIFKLVCLVFDGRQEESVTKAQDKWRAYKNAGHTLKYFRQQENGNWAEKASTQ